MAVSGLGFGWREDLPWNIGLSFRIADRGTSSLSGPPYRLWSIEETPCFSGLLQSIDEADRKLIREKDGREAAGQR